MYLSEVLVLMLLAVSVGAQGPSGNRNGVRWKTVGRNVTRADGRTVQESAPIPMHCVTTTGQRCVFPFKFRGRVYSQCTYDNTDNGQPWCAYSTHHDGTARYGQWHDCDTSTCYITEEPCHTVSGPDSRNTCKFPFIFNGVWYNSCATWTWNDQNYGKRWCSTQTDSNRWHVRGSYGFCGTASACYGSQNGRSTEH